MVLMVIRHVSELRFRRNSGHALPLTVGATAGQPQ